MTGTTPLLPGVVPLLSRVPSLLTGELTPTNETFKSG